MLRKFIITVSFIILAVVYVATIRGIQGNIDAGQIKNKYDQPTMPFELSPERGRYLLTMSLAENNSFSLSKELADAAYPDVGYYQGKFYIFFAPGMSLFALPFYIVGSYFNLSQVASYAVVALFAMGTAIFLYKLARNMFGLSIWASYIATLIFAVGSTSLSYANTLYQHHATTFFIISSLYAVYKYKQKRSLSWVWASFVWLNYGLAILIDYPNGLLFLPVLMYFFLVSFDIKKQAGRVKFGLRPTIIVTSSLFLIITGWHAYYNQQHFGSFKRVSGSLVGYKAIQEKNLFTTQDGKSTISQLEKEKDPVKFFSEQNLPFGFYELTVAPDKGLFFFSPIFILALFGLYQRLQRQKLEDKIMIAVVVVNIFLYGSFGDPWGGWAFGPRYLIPSMAVLSLFVAYWLGTFSRKTIRALVAIILFAYSSAIALLGALTTNAIPPKVEADYLKTGYNFMRNLLFFNDGRSSSYVFNTFLSHQISLQTFFIVIYMVVLSLFTITLLGALREKQYEN